MNIYTLVENEVRNEILYPFLDKNSDDCLYVELGVFIGGNVSKIAQRFTSPQFKIVGIDTWSFDNISSESLNAAELSKNDNFEQVCINNLQQYNNITLIKNETNKCVNMFEDESIDCIFIDAAHASYEYHVNELNLWLPKIKIGGLISGHDWPVHSIQNAVKRTFDNNKIFVCSSNGGYGVIK